MVLPTMSVIPAVPREGIVLNLPASGETTYQTLAGTLCDSTDAGVCWSVFFVRAHTAVPTTYYDSQPDSGYSVDNLAPEAPTGLQVAYDHLGNTLTWDESPSPDLRSYLVYRGTTAGFLPGGDNLVAAVAATEWISLVRLSTPTWAFMPKYH